jgi:hypothetical protein
MTLAPHNNEKKNRVSLSRLFNSKTGSLATASAGLATLALGVYNANIDVVNTGAATMVTGALWMTKAFFFNNRQKPPEPPQIGAPV